MKWLIGIALVMLAAHLYFKYGQRRLERQRRVQAPAEPASRQQPPEG